MIIKIWIQNRLWSRLFSYNKL